MALLLRKVAIVGDSPFYFVVFRGLVPVVVIVDDSPFYLVVFRGLVPVVVIGGDSHPNSENSFLFQF